MTTPRYALLVQWDPGREYAHVRASMVQVDPTDGGPRNLATDDAYTVDPMAGIVATAQADREHRAGVEEAPAYTYAWALGMEPHCFVAVIPALAATLATLRRAERAMTRTAERYGAPATFGAYLARLADALAVPIMTGATGSDGMYSSGAWVEWKPGDAVRIVDRWVAEWRREGVPA